VKDLHGQVALITGGSRGIGRALGIQLVALGVEVYACARDAEELRATESLCSGEGSFTGVQADVTDIDAMRALISRIESERGRLDALVNNAAILGPRERLEDVELGDWQRTQAVNVDGVFIASKLSLPLMRRAGGGMMLNVSSSVGRVGRASWGPYGVSKHAVEGITETLADELAGDDICVVSVNPGGTATDMRHEAYPDEDPDTLPTAGKIARTFALLLQRLDVAQTGRKYDSRNLLDLIDRPEVGGAELPFVQ
jgi:NAD(P)-dependent dehydrogenase (short-subunit alcohol dehydrogenase family)